MAVPTSSLTWRLCCEHGETFVAMLQLNETALSLDLNYSCATANHERQLLLSCSAFGHTVVL